MLWMVHKIIRHVRCNPDVAPRLTSGGYIDKVDVITLINILFTGGGEFWSLMKIKMMIMMMVMMMRMTMTMMTMTTIVSVEQRPGWGGHVKTVETHGFLHFFFDSTLSGQTFLMPTRDLFNLCELI